MRPLALELEGFAAFRDPVCVDLADADLFAIVGATGHGKSTLIDAICFALYGSVPRHPQREIAPVMTLGVNETKVSFTFEVAATTYVATRLLRRSGDKIQTKGRRFERIADGTAELLGATEKEFEAAVLGVIGLDFGQFTKCVVLPQGDFAAFLHASKGDRVEILSALLDLGRYDRMGAAARERAKVASGRLRTLAEERARLGECTDQQLTETRDRRNTLVTLRADLDGAAPRDRALAEAIATAQTRADNARRAASALAAVEIPEAARELAKQIDAARAAIATSDSAAVAAESEAMEAEAERDALPKLDALTDAVAAHREREGVEGRIAKGKGVLATRAEAADAAKGVLAAADAELEALELALADAQHRHAHAELRSSLQVGEPCPVCEQDVVKLPPKGRATELTNAKKAAAAQKKLQRTAQAASSQARAEYKVALELLDSLQEQAAAFPERVEVFPDAKEAAALLDSARRAERAAKEARAGATKRHAAARTAAQDLTRFDDAAAKADAVMQAQRDAVIAAGLEPPAGDWDTLAVWAEEARPEREKHASELDEVARGQLGEREELFDDLATRARDAGVAAPNERTLNALTLALVQSHHDVDEQVRRIEAQLARAAEIDAAIGGARADEQVATMLGQLLDKRHFGQWLVDEALQALVDGASALLERLSGDQYALTTSPDGDLLVVDHANADETRSVRSLSGGETFQASLALALALADRIADLAVDGAAALESIFLDEGFGTLDPETLDVVAGTIESLGHGERVVGVVTHVADLAERMPVRFRVRKEGRTSIVTREDS